MTNAEGSGPGVALRTWFRRDVEDKLSEVVGGQARLRFITLLACVLGLENADTATVGAVAAPLEHALRIGNARLGLLVTVSTAVGALATLPMGVLVDRVSRVRLLTAAIVVWSAAMVISGLAQSYLMLLVTRLALGVVVATAGPAVASLTGDLFLPGERGRVFGYILSGELIGTGVGVLIAGDVAGVWSWRVSFIVLAVPGLLLAGAIHRLLREPSRGGQSRLYPHHAEGGDRREVGDSPGEEPDADQGELADEIREAGVAPHPEHILDHDPGTMPLPSAVRYVLSVRTNVVLIVASALGYFFFSGLRTFGVEFLRGRFGLGQSIASTLFVVVGAGAVVGVLSSGRVADRLIGQGHLAARPLVTGVAFLTAAVLFAPGLLVVSLAAALPLILLAGFAYGATNPPLDAARLDIMQHHLWGRAEAVRTVLRSLFEAAAPLVFGVVSADFGGGHAGFAASSGTKTTAAVAKASASGLDSTFLIMLVPLVVAGTVLLVVARRTYPRDVATAVASESRTRHETSAR